jgi:hypothetical protein
MIDNEPVLIFTAKNRFIADTLIMHLKHSGIPAYRSPRAGSDILDIYTGTSIFGEDIYVGKTDADLARKIIAEDTGEDGD